MNRQKEMKRITVIHSVSMSLGLCHSIQSTYIEIFSEEYLELLMICNKNNKEKTVLKI